MVRLLIYLIKKAFRYTVMAIKWVYLIVRFLLPYILSAIGFSFQLVVLSAVSFWMGVPKTANRIAQVWLEGSAHRGAPSQFDRLIYHLAKIAAYFTIIAAWFLQSLLWAYIIYLLVFIGVLKVL